MGFDAAFSSRTGKEDYRGRCSKQHEGFPSGSTYPASSSTERQAKGGEATAAGFAISYSLQSGAANGGCASAIKAKGVGGSLMNSSGCK